MPSYHHQSVLTHPGYEAAAWADDGTLEAMEDPDARFRLGGAVAPRGRGTTRGSSRRSSRPHVRRGGRARTQLTPVGA